MTLCFFQEKEKRLAAEAAAKFDYFARVKESISVAPVEKLAKVGQYNDDEDYFEVISGVCSCHRVMNNIKQNTHYLGIILETILWLFRH